MMRVFMGIARGLCDNILLSMIKTYMDMHRLSHYESHSDQELRGGECGTLQYLDTAVTEFFHDLLNPGGTLVQSNLIRGDFMMNKLHAMIHYLEWVHEKDSLPQFSTNCTEALHRIYK